jgi:hypothetical protein
MLGITTITIDRKFVTPARWVEVCIEVPHEDPKYKGKMTLKCHKTWKDPDGCLLGYIEGQPESAITRNSQSFTMPAGPGVSTTSSSESVTVTLPAREGIFDSCKTQQQAVEGACAVEGSKCLVEHGCGR